MMSYWIQFLKLSEQLRVGPGFVPEQGKKQGGGAHGDE
jgi:hypothetical protein